MKTTSGKQRSNNYEDTTQWKTKLPIFLIFSILVVSTERMFISEHKMNKSSKKIAALQLWSNHLENIGEGVTF